MAGERIRSLKPEWLDDEKLAATSDTARMLSAALILLSDDHGRGRGNKLFLASRVYPYSSRDTRETLAILSGGLKELCDCGFLRLYQVAGQDYFAVVNWRKHQRVDKPGKPRVPEPLAEVSGDTRETLAPDLGSGSGSGSQTKDQGPGTSELFATHPAGGLAATRKPRSSARQAAPTGDTWTAYASAYRLRYGADPLRNATVNGQLSRLLQRVPGDEAPAIAQHYLSSNNARYVAAGHAVGCLLQDAEKLRTEWLTGRRTTAHEVRAVDRSSGRAAQYEQVFAQLRAEDLEEATTNG